MFGRMVMAATLAVALGATAAQAQIGFPGGGRGGEFPGGMGRGGRGGMRGGMGRMSQPVVIPDLRNPLRLIVDNKDDLKLTGPQLQQVDSLRRALDTRDDTLIAQVKRGLGEDSALATGGEPARRGGDSDNPDERRARAQLMHDRMKALQPTFEQIRKNQDEGWKTATALLQKDQRKRADQIRKDDRKAWQDAHQPFGAGWRGGGGGGDDD